MSPLLFPRRGPALAMLCAAMLCVANARAATRNVPADYATIQAAIDASSNGDVVLLAPGTYFESPTISGKAITVASRLYTTNDRSYIASTIIDGGGTGWAIHVLASSSPPSVIGLTLRHADDGLRAVGHLNFIDCRATGNTDGCDYDSGGGGLIQRCVFEGNGDDGIDINNRVDITIENCTIQDNGDDGIEIRMQNFSGPALALNIRWNTFARNGEDGIQLIGYDVRTNRTFQIEHNLFMNNAMAGVGMMGGSNTVENYEGASLPERIGIVHNTFHGNNHGITGGDSTIVVDNVICHTTNIALKNLDAGSIASHNLLFANGTDQSLSNVDAGTTLHADPLLQPDGSLGSGSPAIDAGTASFTWNGVLRWSESAGSYNGAAPDLGAKETGALSVPGEGAARSGVELSRPMPDPSRGAVGFRLEIATRTRARLEILDSTGRRVRALLDETVAAGPREISWDGRDASGHRVAPGVYHALLTCGGETRTRRLVRVE